MASRLIQFPVRNAFAPIRSHDSLARDTDFHASRVAQQVEEEMARKARRMSVGLRIQLADARSTNLIVMPASRLARMRRRAMLDKGLGFASAAVAAMLRRMPAR